jgi:hypothetical protein
LAPSTLSKLKTNPLSIIFFGSSNSTFSKDLISEGGSILFQDLTPFSICFAENVCKPSLKLLNV